MKMKASRMPWQVTAAVGVSFLAFTLAAGVKPLLVVFALLIGLSYFNSFRLGDSMMRWWVRLALLFLAVTLQMGDAQPQGQMIGPVRGRNVLALAAAAEIVMQFWRSRPKDPQWGPLAALLFSGLLLLAATNATGEAGLLYTTPLFFALALLAVRRVRGHGAGGGRWAATLLATLTLAGVGASYISGRRNELMEVGLNLMAGRFGNFGQIGESDRPRLGPLFGMRGSPARVLRVEGFDGGHLRGNAFYDYALGGWGPATQTRKFRPAGSNTLAIDPPSGAKVREAKATRYGRNSLVWAPLATAAFDLEDAESPEYAPGDDGPLRTHERPPYVYRFRYLDGLPGETFQGVFASPLSPESRARCLKLPNEVRPALERLASVAVGEKASPAVTVQRTASYLLDNHRYSLRWRPSGERGDPVVEFLEKKQSAHCEFFASAAALLLRARGVPTRYVTGYFAHEGTPGGVVARERDAHAWCEAWIDEVGWVTVEATPPSGQPGAEKEQGIEGWRRAWEWMQDWWQRATEWLSTLSMELLFAVGGGIMALGGLVALARFLMRRRSELPRDSFVPPAALAPLAARFEIVLKHAGIPAAPARPWSEALDALPEGLRSLAAIFVERYQAVRFGTSQDLSGLESSLSALEKAAFAKT